MKSKITTVVAIAVLTFAVLTAVGKTATVNPLKKIAQAELTFFNGTLKGTSAKIKKVECAQSIYQHIYTCFFAGVSTRGKAVCIVDFVHYKGSGPFDVVKNTWSSPWDCAAPPPHIDPVFPGDPATSKLFKGKKPPVGIATLAKTAKGPAS